MSNFLLPSFQFPELGPDGVLLTSFTTEIKVPCFDPEDFGKFVLAALSDPGKYGEQAIDLAIENLGMEEIAKLIGKVSLARRLLDNLGLMKRSNRKEV
jgi:hypothetical protein